MEKSLELRPFYIGEIISFDIKNQQIINPNICHFGGKIGEEELLNRLLENEKVSRILSMGEGAEGEHRYLIEMENPGGLAYQELYVLQQPFLDRIGENDYTLYDGRASVRRGEDYLGDILFPTLIFDTRYSQLNEWGGIDIQESVLYPVRENAMEAAEENFNQKDKKAPADIIEFVAEFYQSSALYQVTMQTEESCTVTINEEATRENPISYVSEEKIESVYRGAFQIRMDYETEQIEVVLL